MSKSESSKQITLGDVNCLENLVVAYNTVFLMSSIFLVSIAATANELFSDINRILSPSLLLPTIGIFIILLSGVGYVGVAKRSTTLISIYTQLLVFIFALEIAAGLGILSYRSEIRSMISSKIKKALSDYPIDPLTANLVDYFQLEFQCCGANNYWDWDNILGSYNNTQCYTDNVILPQSCCKIAENATMLINKRGCLLTLNFLLHKSSVLLALGILAISTIQILGAYFSYSLASNLQKFKVQRLNAMNASLQQNHGNDIDSKEKINYF